MPNLIYIYNYLENKLSSDILCIIINNYLSLFTTKQLNKYSINNHLKYYISTSNIRKDANNKFILNGINTNTNSIGITYSLYNFQIKCYIESLFIKYVNLILKKYINN